MVPLISPVEIALCLLWFFWERDQSVVSFFFILPYQSLLGELGQRLEETCMDMNNVYIIIIYYTNSPLRLLYIYIHIHEKINLQKKQKHVLVIRVPESSPPLRKFPNPFVPTNAEDQRHDPTTPRGCQICSRCSYYCDLGLHHHRSLRLPRGMDPEKRGGLPGSRQPKRPLKTYAPRQA